MEWIISDEIFNDVRDHIEEIRNDIENNEELELELRFGNFFRKQTGDAKFNSEVPYVYYDRLLNLLDKAGLERIDEIEEVQYDKEVENLRKVIRTRGDTEEVIWQKKEKLKNIDIKEYDVRLSLNKETNLEYDAEIVGSFSRSKIKSSFIMDGYRVDISHVTSINNKVKNNKLNSKYEVEVEMVDFEYDKFRKGINDIFKWLKGTKYIYTNTQKNHMINDVNLIFGYNDGNNLNKSVLVDARNIKEVDIKWGGIVGNKDYNYMITYKADGLRKMMIFHQGVIWLVYPPYEFNLISYETQFSNKIYSVLKTIIFDGEYVKLKDNKEIYLAFDCLAIKSEANIQKSDFVERRKIILDFKDNLNKIIDPKKKSFDFIQTKRTEIIETPESFYRLVNEFLDEKDDLKYNEDGLMFFPKNSCYNPHSEKNPLSQRKLKLIPDTCKWKHHKDMTIDFKIKWVSGNKLELLVYDEELGEEVPFVGNDQFKLDSDMIDHQNPLTMNKPTNTVVEYEFSNGMLKPRRIRYDKYSANKLEIALDNWKNIMDPITEKSIRGRDFTFTFNYHNEIKWKLYNTLSAGSNILDIGSGYGGDVLKWKSVLQTDKGGYIVAVEPNLENIKQLESRISEHNLTSKVKIINTVGQDYETITSAVKNFLPGGKADAITLMLSLSFFWENSNNLNSLVKTIVDNLQERGKILFLTIDGYSVTQYFEPLFSPSLWTDKKQLLSAEINLYPKDDLQEGRKLLFNLPDTIVGEQLEYLVYLQDLFLRLQSHGFTILDLKKADSELLLSKPNKIFTSLYSYGILQHQPTKKSIPKKSIPKKSIIKTPTSVKTPPKNIIKKQSPTPLKNVDDDDVHFCPCDWYQNLYTISTIADGNCLIHSVLKAMYPTYQNNPSIKSRVALAKNFRKELAALLSKQNPKYPNHTYWSSVSSGSFPRMTMLESVDDTLIDDLDDVDYSLIGLISLFNSNEFLGNEIFKYVAEILDIDIYIFEQKNKNIIPNTFTRITTDKKPSICIVGDKHHFEVLTLFNGKYFETFFDPNHPFINTISSLHSSSINPAEPFDPDQSFIRNAAEIYHNNSTNKLELPDSLDYFDDNDPFITLLKTHMSKIKSTHNQLFSKQ